jgi:phosphoribosylformylglycinamidine synthase
VTDNLNFGSPERPEIMGQLVKAIEGIGEACRALDFPIVSGNVSLYNETNGLGILPTPAIGGVGLLPDLELMATIGFKAAGDAIVLIGGHGTHLGQSMFLREIIGREDGAPPPVDLAFEKRNGDFVRGLVRSREVNAVHDISDGGLIQSLAEMVLASGRFGARMEAMDHVELFGEDQARYLVACADPHSLLRAAKVAGVVAEIVGTVTSLPSLIVGDSASISLGELRLAHEGWFPAYMANKAA